MPRKPIRATFGVVALLLALGRLGVVGRALENLFDVTLFGTLAGVIVAETFVAMPFLVLTVEGALKGLDPRFEVLEQTSAERLAGAAYERALEGWARADGAMSCHAAGDRSLSAA